MNPHPKVQPDGTITCPTCERKHACFYRVGVNDRILCYYCDRQKHVWYELSWSAKEGKDVPVEMWKYTTKIMHLPMEEGLPIPEEYTPALKARQAKKAQLQLVMMQPRRDR